MIQTLRPYQLQALEETSQAFRSHRRVVLVLPTGAGKTTCAAEIIRRATARGRRIFFIAHRKELIEQCSTRLDQFGIDHGIIMANHPRRLPYLPVQIASIQTLANRSVDTPPNLIIVDECFPSGTLIDGRPIETIAVGEYVNSCNHRTGFIEKKKVTSTFKKKPSTMCRIHLEDGRRIDSTQEHPFFTGNSYRPAIQLERGDELLTNEAKDVFNMQSGIHSEVLEFEDDSVLYKGMRTGRNKEALESCPLSMQGMQNDGGEDRQEGTRANSGQSGLLFRKMQGRVRCCLEAEGGGASVPIQQDVCLGAHEVKQPDAVDGKPVKDVSNIEEDKAPPQDTRWERDRPFAMRGEAVRCTAPCARRSAETSLCSVNEERSRERVPEPLQDRLGNTLRHGGGGGRRELSLRYPQERAGQEKARTFRVVRVDRVEVLEQTSDGTFGEVCCDGHVYNIEVEDNNNYFASGVLVHNCHRISGASYQEVIESLGNLYILGLTATPIRSDNKGLASQFDYMVQGPTVRELTDMGFLVPAISYAGKRIDLSGVGMRGADYNPDQLADWMNKPHLIGDCVTEWKRLADGRSTMLFAAGVQHSKDIVEAFRAAGVLAEHLDGNTPKDQRESILSRLADGSLTLVSNAMVLTEGVDIVRVSCIVLARPTKSPGLFLQMAGRASRPHPGKSDMLLLDHGNCIRECGLVAQDRNWQLLPDSTSKRGKSVSYAETFKVCPDCGKVAELTDLECSCGYHFSSRVKQRQLKVYNGQLELVEEKKVRSYNESQRKAKYFRLLEDQHIGAKKDGCPFAQSYAVVKYAGIFKDRPPMGWREEWNAENEGLRLEYKERWAAWSQRDEPQSCYCHMGHPPCGWCISPDRTEEDFQPPAVLARYPQIIRAFAKQEFFLVQFRPPPVSALLPI